MCESNYNVKEITDRVTSTAIDSVKRTITVLAPSPGRLPSLTAVYGSFEWQDT